MSRRAPGGCSRRSTTMTRGQPADFDIGRRHRGLEVRPHTRPRQSAPATPPSHAAPARAARSSEHVARVPCGHPFLLQRLVGVVDDDRGREIGNGRERGDPPADDDAVPGCAPAATRRCAPRRDSSECSSATGWPRPASVRASDAARDAVGDAHDRRPGRRDQPLDELTAVVQRRHPPHFQPHRAEPASNSFAERTDIDAGSCRVGGADVVRGRRGAEHGDARAAPAPRDPLAELDDSRGRALGDDRERSSRRARPRARRRRRPPSPAPAGRAAARARSCRRARARPARPEPDSRRRARPR